MTTCWWEFEDGKHTCMELADHDGPHVPTPDTDIIIRVVPQALEEEE